MKVLTVMKIIVVAFAGLALLRLEGVAVQPEEARIPWLTLPEIDGRVTGNGTVELTSAPDAVQAMVIHIPAGGPHINYGTIHTKVNTESADIATRSASGSEGFELKVDLTAAGGFRFQPGRNSVELEYQDQFGRQKYFNFLITFEGGPGVLSGSDARGIIPETANRAPEKRAARLYAVVIGISRYDQSGSSIGNLKFADKDAMGFLDFLKSPAGGGLTEDSMTVLLNEKATTENVRHALFTFLTAAQPQDTVVIYIAGHGAPDPHDPRNLYLLTADSKPDDMGGTAFPMWQMQDVFERVLKAKRVITIADTCHSFGFSGARNAGKAQEGNNLINQYLQHYAAKGARAVITASDISEPSFEDTQWGEGHGVFTYYLLKGLKGEADRNHDGIVTAGELFSYLRREVPQATGGKQNPRAMEGLASALPVSVLRGAPTTVHSKAAVGHGLAQ